MTSVNQTYNERDVLSKKEDLYLFNTGISFYKKYYVILTDLRIRITSNLYQLRLLI